MPYPLPQDFYDSNLSRPLSASATEVYVDVVPTVTAGVLTIYDATDNKTPVEKIYYTAVDSVNKKLTGLVRKVYTTPQSSQILFTSSGTGEPHSKGARIALTDNINYAGLSVAILNGDQETGGVVKYPNARTISDPRHLVDKEYADALTVAGLMAFVVTDNGGITINVNSGYYNWNGDHGFYAGASNQSLTDDTVNYVEFKDGALSINTTAFSEDAVSLAKVTTASGDITVLEDARTFITIVDIRPDAAAYLTCGTAGTSNPATWAAITDGSFTVTIDGTSRDITAIDFTGDASMSDVAATIQAAIRAVTSGSEVVTWSTDHFVITSGITGSISEISVLTTEGSGTDISGSSYMNGQTGDGTATAGTWAGIGRDSEGLYLLLGDDLKVQGGNVAVISSVTATANSLIKAKANGKIDESRLQMTDSQSGTLVGGSSSNADTLHEHTVLSADNLYAGPGEATATKTYATFQLSYNETSEAFTLQGYNTTLAATWFNGNTTSGANPHTLITQQPIWPDPAGVNQGIRFSNTKKVITEFRLSVISTGNNQMGWGLAATVTPFTDYDDNTVNSVNFSVDASGNLYAHTSDGAGGNTETAISGVTLTNMNTYRIEWDPGTDAKFYVNGVLEATITTNLPTAGNLNWGFGGESVGTDRPESVTAPWFSIEN